MFWGRKKGSGQETPEKRGPSFEEAKEAARRAVFLNTAAKMSSDVAYKQSLAELFRVCRTEAIRAGVSQGLSEPDIDRSISELCDSDVERLKAASDEEFRLFTQESGDVVKGFLAALP